MRIIDRNGEEYGLDYRLGFENDLLEIKNDSLYFISDNALIKHSLGSLKPNPKKGAKVIANSSNENPEIKKVIKSAVEKRTEVETFWFDPKGRVITLGTEGDIKYKRYRFDISSEELYSYCRGSATKDFIVVSDHDRLWVLSPKLKLITTEDNEYGVRGGRLMTWQDKTHGFLHILGLAYRNALSLYILRREKLLVICSEKKLGLKGGICIPFLWLEEGHPILVFGSHSELHKLKFN